MANTDGARDVAKERLLILVVAYHAASTLRSVLDRIPDAVLDRYDSEILVVDDASTDGTFELAQSYMTDHPGRPLRVLRNQLNQGYGGNQKVGYAYASRYGFDLVALLHGDGQYAPEKLPDLLAPFDDGADMVFGSRMSQKGMARRGGMPFYKYVGNRILSRMQNTLLRTSFSEFHSGYRAYRVSALERTHFRLNTNDFHFDTEIILELLANGADIREVPIPTYYGDEISRVNGIAYAGNVMRVTLQFVVHRFGLLHQRRFEPMGHTPYQRKLGYASSQQWAVDAVPAGASVIDLGAGNGVVAESLRTKGCLVAATEQPEVAALADDTIALDLNGELDIDLNRYDYLLLLDVIEHVYNPEAFLDRLRARFTHQPKTLILTTPNVGFVVTRLALLFGQFNYGQSGILDRTHTRLFTFRTVRKLLTDAGFRIRQVRGIPAPFPAALGETFIATMLLSINRALIRLSRRLFSFQIFVVAESTPDLDFLIADAIRNEFPDMTGTSEG